MPKILNNEPEFLMSLEKYIDHIDATNPFFDACDMFDVVLYKMFLNCPIKKEHLVGDMAIFQRLQFCDIFSFLIASGKVVRFKDLAKEQQVFYIRSEQFNSLLYDIKEEYSEHYMDRD